MDITCISDLHGYYPKLDGGDLLIVAGDLTATDTHDQHIQFALWLRDQKYKKKIVIAGNHDVSMQKNMLSDKTSEIPGMNCTYLCDSGTEFEGLKIWGSPWSLWFPGINPKCTAFTGNENKLMHEYEKIPTDIDILITHTPPYGILDKCRNGHVGSESLRQQLFRIKPKLNVFGHIHECGGQIIDLVSSVCMNVSIVNERYEHVNKPVRIILNPQQSKVYDVDCNY